MNSIIFIQREIEEKLGVMVLTSHLRSLGYEARIIINPRKNIRLLKKLRPEIIGISLLTPSLKWALATAQFIKAELPDTLLILGGHHPTFRPEVVREPGVDAICVGEGEKSLGLLMERYDGSLSSIREVPNIWLKDGDTIIRNPVSSLLSAEELSNLPPADRTFYQDYPALRKSPVKSVWTSRGCPYGCSYCFNAFYNRIYHGKGGIFRQRSVKSVINELKELKQYGWKGLNIVDDQFLCRREWVEEFCARYGKEIVLPFQCLATATQIEPSLVAILKRAGCEVIYFGIESGVEEIRMKRYNKPVSDDDIYQAAEALHLHGMTFLTYNMVGLPDETVDDIYRTVGINQEIETTYPWCSILQPYPGTAIAEEMTIKRRDQDAGSFPYSYFQESVINDPIKRELFFNAQKLFPYLVLKKVSYDKFVRLVRRPARFARLLYPPVFYWFFGKGLRARYNLSWSAMFRYWIYSKS